MQEASLDPSTVKCDTISAVPGAFSRFLVGCSPPVRLLPEPVQPPCWEMLEGIFSSTEERFTGHAIYKQHPRWLAKAPREAESATPQAPPGGASVAGQGVQGPQQPGQHGTAGHAAMGMSSLPSFAEFDRAGGTSQHFSPQPYGPSQESSIEGSSYGCVDSFYKHRGSSISIKFDVLTKLWRFCTFITNRNLLDLHGQSNAWSVPTRPLLQERWVDGTLPPTSADWTQAKDDMAGPCGVPRSARLPRQTVQEVHGREVIRWQDSLQSTSSQDQQGQQHRQGQQQLQGELVLRGQQLQHVQQVQQAPPRLQQGPRLPQGQQIQQSPLLLPVQRLPRVSPPQPGQQGQRLQQGPRLQQGQHVLQGQCALQGQMGQQGPQLQQGPRPPQGQPVLQGPRLQHRPPVKQERLQQGQFVLQGQPQQQGQQYVQGQHQQRGQQYVQGQQYMQGQQYAQVQQYVQDQVQQQQGQYGQQGQVQQQQGQQGQVQVHQGQCGQQGQELQQQGQYVLQPRPVRTLLPAQAPVEQRRIYSATPSKAVSLPVNKEHIDEQAVSLPRFQALDSPGQEDGNEQQEQGGGSLDPSDANPRRLESINASAVPHRKLMRFKPY